MMVVEGVTCIVKDGEWCGCDGDDVWCVVETMCGAWCGRCVVRGGDEVWCVVGTVGKTAM